jgi:hypothetical protein
MANPNPHQARTAKKQKALETPSIKAATKIVWQALQTAEQHLQDADPNQSLKAVHAICQGALAFAKLHEVSEFEARIESLETFAKNKKQADRVAEQERRLQDARPLKVA